MRRKSKDERPKNAEGPKLRKCTITTTNHNRLIIKPTPTAALYNRTRTTTKSKEEAQRRGIKRRDVADRTLGSGRLRGGVYCLAKNKTSKDDWITITPVLQPANSR
ncbi:hypothetical protein PIB30_018841 [Stylosanthes scabra]|uniref:Uncharacterized protein n=1 Tax=Stylosanthes scabra TaxID=79078 RepID=A0ABU6T7T5_9FABA|nr:hypothetical protein [Stylosanthes scabra]